MLSPQTCSEIDAVKVSLDSMDLPSPGLRLHEDKCGFARIDGKDGRKSVSLPWTISPASTSYRLKGSLESYRAASVWRA